MLLVRAPGVARQVHHDRQVGDEDEHAPQRHVMEDLVQLDGQEDVRVN